MAQDPGTFESWITNRTEHGNTRGSVLVGSFDNWITGRIYFDTYPDAAPAPPVPPTPVVTAVGVGMELPSEELDILEDDDEFLIIYHSSRLLV